MVAAMPDQDDITPEPGAPRMLIDPRFVPVVHRFLRIFDRPTHGGGALAIYLDGRPVVDVWAGWAAPDRRWAADTVALSFSTGKGVAATVLHRVAERGLIDYDAPVAEYWPEFATNGKAAITVREVLAHRAGLHRVRGLAPAPADLLDYDAMVAALAAAPPDPRRLHASGYHAVTFGWLVAEIVRRATGDDFTEVLRREIAEPLGTAEFWYRVPESERFRIAPTFPRLKIPGMRWDTAAAQFERNHVMRGVAEAGMPDGFDTLAADPRVHDAVMPGFNGVFTARSLAQMYGALANGGRLAGTAPDAPPLLRPETIAAINHVQLAERRDYVLGVPSPFTLGYHRPPVLSRRPPRTAFGHYGVGGSGAFADPELRLSVAFVTNRLGNALNTIGDGRMARLGGMAHTAVLDEARLE